MDMSMLEKFNTMFDLEGLKEDIENSSSPKTFVEVPHGKYEVSVASMEMGLTSENSKNPNSPMLKVRFNILSGDFKQQSIFYNQVLTSGFGIHKANTFLESLKSSQEVTFQNFVQYSNLIDSIFSELDREGAEYALNYTVETVKGKDWSKYEVEERF